MIRSLLVLRALVAGCDGYIKKPFTPEQIRDVVLEVIRREVLYQVDQSGLVIDQQHRDIVDDFCEFLSGRTDRLVRELERRMELAKGLEPATC